MPLIRIRETIERGAGSVGESSFGAVLSIDDGVDYPIEIRDPFSEEEEARLNWYFEEHLRRPFLQGVKAQAAANSIAPYGEKLFGQVFADSKAYARYFQLRSQIGRMRIEIEGSPAFHGLHWEALKDPDLPKAFALDALLLRRRRAEQSVPAQAQEAPVLRLLIITARPHGVADIAYRTISRPLVESLRRTRVHVDVDILRPGTYRALDTHLREVSDRHGAGFYHVIHFDTHGALLTQDELQVGSHPRGLVFRRYGRVDLTPYQGQKAFLFLEDEIGKQADPLEAGELARLLTVHQIPVAILNACQSGKQVGASETSLGSRLIDAGAQMVLAMSYSITVSAAEVFISAVYQQLFDGCEVTAAIRGGRQELCNRKTRRAYFNQTIELEDWLLPVAYQNQPVQMRFRAFTAEEEIIYWQRQASSFEAPAPTYGFFGRDLDVLSIERLLLKHNLLLVSGMGGAGKTTLLKHLGHWWQTTDFVDRVFYFAYDEKGWTRQQLLQELGRTLLGEADYHGSFVPLGPAAQQAKLAQMLRGKRHLLIFDNLESITGTHLAIAHGLSESERKELKAFLNALRDGKSLVLLGSRSSEAWLASGTFDDNIYELPGLDAEATSQLAEQILERYQATAYRANDGFAHVLKLLAGFPLALEVVLPNLARQTPEEILEALGQGGDLERGDADSRTRSILRCIDYSHSNLSPAAQGLLECLAPFSGVLNTRIIPEYTIALAAQPALADLPFDRWQEVLDEATDWGLLSPHPKLAQLLQLQPIFPYFLRVRLNRPDYTARKKAIENAYRIHYDNIGFTISTLLDSQDPHERQQGLSAAQLEYENLLHAVELGLRAQASVKVWTTLSKYLLAVHDTSRGLALSQHVEASLLAYAPEMRGQQWAVDLARVTIGVGERQLLLGQRTAAEDSYRRALELLQGDKSLFPEIVSAYSTKIAIDLGRVALDERRWADAELQFKKSLEIAIEQKDSATQGVALNNLGRIAQEQEQWSLAKQYFEAALEAKKTENISAGVTHHNLAIVTSKLGDRVNAVKHFKWAIQIFDKMGELLEQADSFIELGYIANDAGQVTLAERSFHQALEIANGFDDKRIQCRSYHGLAIMEIHGENVNQAQQYLQKALALSEDINDLSAQARVLTDLAGVARLSNKSAAAAEYYLRAIEIFTMVGDQKLAALVEAQLASISKG